MDSPITEDNLIPEMLAAFPELQKAYRQLIEKMGSDVPGQYTIVGQTLAAAVQRQLKTQEMNEFLHRSAAFMERVSVSSDEEALNIIWIRIFEWLIFRPKELRLIWPILGPATKDHIRD